MKKNRYYVYNRTDETVGRVVSQSATLATVLIMSAKNPVLRNITTIYSRKDLQRIKKKDSEAASILWD